MNRGVILVMKGNYIIQAGDNFYSLAKRLGGTCESWLQANPGVNPAMLQVGQEIRLPELKSELKGKQQFAEMSNLTGSEFAGDSLDDVVMELGGIEFRVKRIGETKIPHEIHILLPRAEILKIQLTGENGPTELQVMLSNVTIVHSPRLQGEKGQAVSQIEEPTVVSVQPRPGAAGGPAVGNQAAWPGRTLGAVPEEAAGFPGFAQQGQMGFGQAGLVEPVPQGHSRFRPRRLGF